MAIVILRMISLFQSTHPHGVRLCPIRSLCPRDEFQSTHPHGVRHKALLFLSVHNCFNPRTRMGCDIQTPSELQAWIVSIHAPAWGATLIRHTTKIKITFQSTHPHGVRLGSLLPCLAKLVFQSTHPHGVRLGLSMFPTYFHKFQSTHPHGVRPNKFVPKARFATVSIHAPA